MEFSFDVSQLFDKDITRVAAGRLESGVCRIPICYDNLAEVVNRLGAASAEAQGLRVPITSFNKLKYNKEVLYILKDLNESGKGVVVGIIKVGRRRLFLNDLSGTQHEVEPVSVLDFYVHESRQRSGCGKRLFEAMMQGEGVKPFEIAIDRPSPKFLGFLKKHYDLCSAIHQANHYVVFKEFFKSIIGVHCDAKRKRLKHSLAEESGPLSTFKITQKRPILASLSRQLPASAANHAASISLATATATVGTPDTSTTILPFRTTVAQGTTFSPGTAHTPNVIAPAVQATDFTPSTSTLKTRATSGCANTSTFATINPGTTVVTPSTTLTPGTAIATGTTVTSSTTVTQTATATPGTAGINITPSTTNIPRSTAVTLSTNVTPGMTVTSGTIVTSSTTVTPSTNVTPGMAIGTPVITSTTTAISTRPSFEKIQPKEQELSSQENSKKTNLGTNQDFNWAPGTVPSGPLKERIRYRNRNIAGTGFILGTPNPTTYNKNLSRNFSTFSHCGSGLDARGAGNVQGGSSHVGLNLNSQSRLGQMCEPQGFTRAVEYSRHGMPTTKGGGVGGGAHFGGGRSQLDNKAALLQQKALIYSSHFGPKNKLKDRWKQFIT